MDERQLKGLCYNCDDKYFPGHKCKEQNLFMAISEDIQEDDDDTSPVPESPETSEINPPSDPPAEEPIISLNALTIFFAPQTLKLIVISSTENSSSWLIVAALTTLFIATSPKKPTAISMLLIISKSWLPMVALWNVVGAVKMCVSK